MVRWLTKITRRESIFTGLRGKGTRFHKWFFIIWPCMKSTWIRECHIGGTTNLLQLICIFNQSFKHVRSFIHSFGIKTPILEKNMSFIIQPLINNTQDFPFLIWITIMSTLSNLKIPITMKQFLLILRKKLKNCHFFIFFKFLRIFNLLNTSDQSKTQH